MNPQKGGTTAPCPYHLTDKVRPSVSSFWFFTCQKLKHDLYYNTFGVRSWAYSVLINMFLNTVLEVCRRFGEICCLYFRASLSYSEDEGISFYRNFGRLQLRCDGTRWRTGREVKGKVAKGVSNQYSSHYIGTWYIQHYDRWYAHLDCQ